MDSAIHKRAKHLTRKAHWHLMWETYAPVFAIGVLGICLYFTGAMFGLWQRIGDPWRGMTFLVVAGLMVRSTYKARKHPRPTTSQARRRIEADNHLSHRPFDAIEDTLALGGADDLIWQEHVNTAKAKVNQAAPSRLRAVLSPLDKYKFRFIAPALLIIAAMVGGGDNYERLRASLVPTWMSGMNAKDVQYEAWIDPPEYTGRPPSYFKQSNRVNAPEGSEFIARISGVKTAPRLILRGDSQTRAITPIRLGPKSFEARGFVTENTIASFQIGSHRNIWHLMIGKDLPPKVKFDTDPKAGKRDKLIFSYQLEDDFGVELLSLAMHLKEGDPDKLEIIPVSLPGTSVRSAKEEPASMNMTKHKWAGKIVIGHLVAQDGKLQIGKSEPKEFIIPDKIFIEPLAKAVAEQRQLMLAGTGEYAPIKTNKPLTSDDFENQPLFAIDHPEQTLLRAPKEVQRVADLIEIITDHPSGIYEDPSVYMGLRNIYRRLHTAKDQQSLAGIPQDLWAIALRAEFGLLGDALEDMRAAERALNNAMARRAPARELEVLFDRYNAAVERYMEQLTLEAVKRAKENAGNKGAGGGEGDFETDEIQKLLAAIEEANRLGDTVAARKALAQLAQLLENMQIQLNAGGGSGKNAPSDGGMSEELKQALEELNEILGEQRKLRDETQSTARSESDNMRALQNGSGEKTEAKTARELADAQQKLEGLLDALEENAKSQSGKKSGEEDGSETEQSADNKAQGKDGTIPDDVQQTLKGAKKAMGEAKSALEDGQFYRAGREQSKAIDALREAGVGLYAQEAKRLEEGAKNADANGENADPFGRENNGSGVGDGDEVPEINDRQRARDLLEELRKRSGEQNRDKIEREYLERLLEKF